MPPREVSLPCCPACDLIGKRAFHEGFYHGYCTGPLREPHQRTRLVIRRFIEAPEPEDVRRSPDGEEVAAA
jgi:hypothetical protein